MAGDLPLTPARDAAAAACAPDACEDRRLALLLTTIWATRTGRTPPAVPLSELSPDELVHFWADDQLESPAEVNDQTESAGSGGPDESERPKR